MQRSKFSEEQGVAILREQEAGAKTADLCRRQGVFRHAILALTHFWCS